MKILLLEDNDDKALEIENAIKENFPTIEGIDIVKVDDIIKARQELMIRFFDLMIVDLLVPNIYGDDPNPEASINLLRELKIAPDMNMPNHIIGITAYKEEHSDYEKFFNDENRFLLNYSLSSEEWKEQLKNEIQNINLANKSNGDSRYEYDLAIICALKDPEFEAVKKLSNEWKVVYHKNSPIKFLETTFINQLGEDIRVIATSTNTMGMVATATLTTQIIELFHPQVIAMTGIAAGIEGEVALGDILIANPSWDSGSGKIKKDKKKDKKIFEFDIRQETLDDEIYHKVSDLGEDKVFLNEIYNKFEGEKPGTYLNVHIGPIASGAAVIANSDIREEINVQNRKLIGIEMEIYGLYYAAKHSTNLKPQVLAIKSVCDFADENKADNYQKYAAYTSAQFLYEFAIRNL
jgi:nucleoside phosphorylase